MSDLISRQDAIDIVGYEIDGGYDAIVDRINSLPSAEPRKGVWIAMCEDLKISDYQCNKCGHLQDDVTDFCPSCGADMRGEEE